MFMLDEEEISCIHAGSRNTVERNIHSDMCRSRDMRIATYVIGNRQIRQTAR